MTEIAHGNDERLITSMRGATLMLAAALILTCTACGTMRNASTLVGADLPSSRFCADYVQLLLKLDRPHVSMSVLAPLSRRFAADARVFRAMRAPDAAARTSALARALSPTNKARQRKILDDPLFSQICKPPQAYKWQATKLAEFQIPADWNAVSEPWTIRGRGDVGIALRSGDSMSFGPSPLGNDYRWLFPTAYLAVSAVLATDLGIASARTGVALDRVRRWMDANPVPATCRRTRVTPYVKGVIWGFMRRSDGCGGFGAALLEVYAVALHREPGAELVLLRLTGRYSGSRYGFQRVVSSFHVVH